MIDEDDHKKTEKLEVRLSFEEKEQLKTEASLRGQSISDFVRDILNGNSTPQSASVEATMNRGTRRYVAIIAIASMTLLTGTMLFRSIQTKTTSIELSGTIERSLAEGRVSSRFSSAMELRLDQTFSVTVPPDASRTAQTSSRPYHIIRVTLLKPELPARNASNAKYMLAMDIVEVADGNETVIHSPTISLSDGTVAQYSSRTGERENYEISATVL